MESWRRGRRFLAVLSIRPNGSVCQRVTAPLRFAAHHPSTRFLTMALGGMTVLNLVIPTEAQRSGGTCG